MIIDRYLVKYFIPVFIMALAMFVTLMLLIDLFVNLVTYLTYDVTFKQIVTVSYYYIPKSISFALPCSLLFAVAYTLGDLYARNELTSVISSGIPFWRLGASFLIVGAIISVFSFFFDDRIVIPSLKIKNQLSKELKHQQDTAKDSAIVIKTRDGKRIYSVDYYDYDNLTLNGVIIIEKDDNGDFLSQIRAQLASWNGTHWVFINSVIYEWEKGQWKNDVLRVHDLSNVDKYDDNPELFRRSAIAPEELNVRDARLLVEDLKIVGLPFIVAEADYYHRFSFPSTSFIVVILSLSMGGRFRKNIILMSLLMSLAVAVIFYVMEMLTMMMGRLGYIPPIMGAWFPVIFFTVVGAVLIRFSKT